MKKEDFKNPFEWVMYKVNGKIPVDTAKTDKTPKTEEYSFQLVKHMLPKNERKYGLKYYHNSNGRYTAMYHQDDLSMCSYEDIPHIQEYFDNHFTGKNIIKISRELKNKYNQNMKKAKRGVKGQPYSKNRLNFQQKQGGRLCARVNDKGKVHTICQCYENQKNEVSNKYDVLKKEYDIDTIKEIMKNEYNIIGRKGKKARLNKHQINIREDGAVYKDGQFITVDSKVYDIIDTYITRTGGLK